jgi:cytoskeletal protein RodZ
MKMRTSVLALFAILGLAGCTQVQAPTATPTASATPTATPSATTSPSAPPGCHYQEVQCIKAPCNPVLVCESPSPSNPSSPKSSATPKSTVKSEVKSSSTVTNNSSTNININSNGTNVKITVKDGKRYAEVNGKEVQLDANGCYDYDQNGTKIHSCVNN